MATYNENSEYRWKPFMKVIPRDSLKNKKPVETTNEQPKKEYCIAKCKSNKPEGYEDCKCHNFCKFDGIQFDTSLG